MPICSRIFQGRAHACARLHGRVCPAGSGEVRRSRIEHCRGVEEPVTGQVAILADDLTGALDAAAAFATPARPVRAVWTDIGLDDGGDFAVDSETRAVPEDEAEATVARLLPRLQ